MRPIFQALIAFFLLFMICQVSAVLINTTFTQVLSASNTTGVSGSVTPILSGLGNVFQIVAGIFGIGIFVILFAIILGGRRDEITPYQ